MRTWLATSALTCCVIQSRTLFCASCACAGVATLPVPIAHTRSYAITTRFQSDTSFMLAAVHTVTAHFQSATSFMLAAIHAVTTHFQSATSFMLAAIHAVTTHFQSATYFMLPTVTLLHYNIRLSGITRVSRYQKGKTNLDFTEARDSEWQWHQLGHMQTDNHASTPPLSCLQAGCPSCNSVKALKAKLPTVESRR